MIEAKSLDILTREVDSCVQRDRGLLDELRKEVRALKTRVRRIQPHAANAVSLVGTDGGNNYVKYDPFMLELIRVVDSSNREYCLEALTPRTSIEELTARHIDAKGQGLSTLGRLMQALNVSSIYDVASIARPTANKPPKPTWMKTYREVMEWATLYELVALGGYGSDTLIVRDGFLRSKIFAGFSFTKVKTLLSDAIASHYKKTRRHIYLAGVARNSSILQTYGLAFALEGILRTTYPAYLEVPRAMEERVYQWDEYARGDDNPGDGREGNRFVAGKMFLVKFGNSPSDPIWAVDIFDSQVDQASTILGHMLHDAIEGFPVPFYPQCLQRAHEHAVLVDFDMQIIQDRILASLRTVLGKQHMILDELSMQVADPIGR